MNRNTLLVALLAFVLGAGIGIVGYISAVGGSGEASEPITAPTLNPFNGEALATENAALRAQVETLSTAAAAVVVSTPEVEAPVSTEEPAATEEPTPEAESSEPAAAGAATIFSIVPEESQVSFTLEEDLRGVRTTVIGTTDQVAGQIEVNFANPATSRIGVIRINVRTLETDSGFRDSAIRGEILLSSRAEYEFSDFTPKQVIGLPDSVAVGDTITFQVVGDLPLAGVTREVTFDVTLTVVSEDRIEGTGTTTVLRTDYGLESPSVPSVANVTDEVELEIAFVATAQ
ncbi:MAG: YceI family protein [Anaerolineae bacterium]|jgi:polyisoprenoid-binding protein YceI|nr:YceI family protein [Anaerolineae bacterium]